MKALWCQTVTDRCMMEVLYLALLCYYRQENTGVSHTYFNPHAVSGVRVKGPLSLLALEQVSDLLPGGKIICIEVMGLFTAALQAVVEL